MAPTPTQIQLYQQMGQLATKIRADTPSNVEKLTWVEACTIANQIIFNDIVKMKP